MQIYKFHIPKIFKNQSSYGDVNYYIAKQHPLLKSTTARVTALCLTCGDD